MNAEKELLSIIQETCVEKGGKLIIPSFSVGRTQEIVYTLNNFYNQNRLPRIEIYVDSPLAVNATEIFRLHPECFNQEILEVMERDPDPFGFNSLHYIRAAEDSKKLNKIKKPVIIISASGMMEAGRVKHHLANSISNADNTVLAVGYCAPNTLGARLLRGDKEVSIHGNKYEVNADIKRIDSYSGHGDYKEMADFISCQDPGRLQQLFLVHGEIGAQSAYKQYLEEKGFNNIHIPERGTEYEF
ncbi:MAG: MBL fold metallo-hydrolase RNA specificity domain-containing protein [Bacteroidales bacterium]